MSGKGEIILLAPNPTNACFGCGGANDAGMQLTFEQDMEGRRIVGKFRLDERYQGGAGFLHGGIIAVLFDEALGKVCRFRSVRAVTAELVIEYLRPIRLHEEFVVEAHEDRLEGRNLHLVGEIRDATGRVLARSRGRFVVIDPEKYAEKLKG
jgi:uncharacterized protein (TIGR00369 family)